MSFKAPLEANEEPLPTAYFGDGDSRVYFVSEVVRERNHSQHGHQYAVKYKNNQHQWWKALLVAKRFAKFLKTFTDQKSLSGRTAVLVQPQSSQVASSSSSAKARTPPKKAPGIPERRKVQAPSSSAKPPDASEKNLRRPRKRSASRPPNDQQDELDIPIPSEQRAPVVPAKKQRRPRPRSASQPRNDQQDGPTPSEQTVPKAPEKKQRRPRTRSASRPRNDQQNEPILEPVVQMEEDIRDNRSITPTPSTSSQVSSGACTDRLTSGVQVDMSDDQATSGYGDSGNEGSAEENVEDVPVLSLSQSELPNINGSGGSSTNGVEATESLLMSNLNIFLTRIFDEAKNAFVKPALDARHADVAEIQRLQLTLDKAQEEITKLRAANAGIRQESEEKLAKKDEEITSLKSEHLETLRAILGGGNYEDSDDVITLKRNALSKIRKWNKLSSPIQSLLNAMQSDDRDEEV